MALHCIRVCMFCFQTHLPGHCGWTATPGKTAVPRSRGWYCFFPGTCLWIHHPYHYPHPYRHSRHHHSHHHSHHHYHHHHHYGIYNACRSKLHRKYLLTEYSHCWHFSVSQLHLGPSFHTGLYKELYVHYDLHTGPPNHHNWDHRPQVH